MSPGMRDAATEVGWHQELVPGSTQQPPGDTGAMTGPLSIEDLMEPKMRGIKKGEQMETTRKPREDSSLGSVKGVDEPLLLGIMKPRICVGHRRK